MQVVVVLFGYDIEQQVKKIYNRTSITQGTPLLVYAPVEDMRLHNILWWYGLSDIRERLYLAVAWLLHVLIWSSIISGDVHVTAKLPCKSGLCGAATSAGRCSLRLAS